MFARNRLIKHNKKNKKFDVGNNLNIFRIFITELLFFTFYPYCILNVKILFICLLHISIKFITIENCTFHYIIIIFIFIVVNI
jgi:hypothetical protein